MPDAPLSRDQVEALRRLFDAIGAGLRERPLKRPKRAWTLDEIQRLRDGHQRGLTFEELAASTGHPKGACITKAGQLNLPHRDKREQGCRGYWRRRRAMEAEAASV